MLVVLVVIEGGDVCVVVDLYGERGTSEKTEERRRLRVDLLGDEGEGEGVAFLIERSNSYMCLL